MHNDQGRYYSETIIANNEKEAKMNMLALNPNSEILETKWVYK